MTTSKALIEQKSLTPETFREGLQPILDAVADKARIEARNLTDASSVNGRKSITSLAYKVSRTKTLIDDYGKESVADLRRQVAVIDEERRKARDFLDGLRDEIKRPVTEWEEAEKERVQAIHEGIAWFETLAADSEEMTKADMIDCLELLRGSEVDQDTYEEFFDSAKKAKENACLKVEALIARQEKQEREAEEQRKAEEEERLRQEREKQAQADADRQAPEQPASEHPAEPAAPPSSEAQGEWQPEEPIPADERTDPAIGPNATQEIYGPAVYRPEQEITTAEHKRQVNSRAKNALVENCNLTDDKAKEIVTAIVLNRIPGVSVNY